MNNPITQAIEAPKLADEVVRYCPECGTIGPLPDVRQACCPDSFGMSVRRWQAEKMERKLEELRTAIASAVGKAGGQVPRTLTDEECDKAAAQAMDRVAAARDLHALDLNPDITAHHALRRELIRAGCALAAAPEAPAQAAPSAGEVEREAWQARAALSHKEPQR